MRIGIIGAGHIGTVLARRLTTLGHQVVIANSRGPTSLVEVAAKTGATAGSVYEAARRNELVIVTITEKAIPNLPADLFQDVPANVIVVDTGNYYPERDGQLTEIDAGLTESRWVERHLGRPVVKAFNSIISVSLSDKQRHKGAADRVALPVAGDDPVAKADVMQLVDDVGFDPIDAGSIEESWRQQPGTPVYCKDYDTVAVRKALAEARRDQTLEYRRLAAEQAKVYYAAMAAKT